VTDDCCHRRHRLLPLAVPSRCSHTSGPGLVQFSNMQLSPEAFNAWLTSSFVHRYLTRAYWLDRAIPTAGSRCACVRWCTVCGLSHSLSQDASRLGR
jgi:hypothetical protein